MLLPLLLAFAPVQDADPAALTREIAEADAHFFPLFFEGCDPAAVTASLTQDFEMFHDKGGLVAASAAPFVEAYARECEKRKQPDAWRSRRELVPGTMKVWPVPGYGAIEEADHVFYERKGDGPERLAGRSHLVQVWKREDGKWKLARVFSYAHQAAP